MNTKSKSLIIGLVALAIGVAIGVAGTELHNRGTGSSNTEETNPGQAPPLALFSDPNFADSNQWDPFREIQRMQEQMNQSFNQMFEQFRTQPQFNVFQQNPNYSSSLNMQDLKDRYVVQAFLPDAKASDVHVRLNGQTLKVQVSGQSGETNAVSQISQWGQYEQVVQLPTPVNADKMSVKHEGRELIITIPKTK